MTSKNQSIDDVVKELDREIHQARPLPSGSRTTGAQIARIAGERFIAIKEFNAGGLFYKRGDPIDLSGFDDAGFARMAELRYFISESEFERGKRAQAIRDVLETQVRPLQLKLQEDQRALENAAREVAGLQQRLESAQIQLRERKERLKSTDQEIEAALTGKELSELLKKQSSVI